MKVLFYTLGCKVNQYETQAMRAVMENAGYTTADAGDNPCPETEADTDSGTDAYAGAGADIAVVNSCTVTGESDRKLRQLLRRIRRQYPGAVAVLTGCMPQAFPETAAAYPEADIILGNAARGELPLHIERFLTNHMRIVHIPAHSDKIEPLEIRRFQGRTRAFVKIEDGCNRFCSYCIIPYARGRVRSKPPDALGRELEQLAAAGYSEVVLAGINLTAYGQEWGMSLCDAVELACGMGSFRRIRLGSLEPDTIDADFISRLAAVTGLCPQFHLSLQSGCLSTLKRMNRRYTPEQYAGVCRSLREVFPGCAITTDIMVGFPGEDDEEFRQALEFVREIGFARAHVFAYSPRPGTPAAQASGQVPEYIKAERSREMIRLCDESRDAYLDKMTGGKAEVMAEAMSGGEWTGHTPEYVQVNVTGVPDSLSLSAGDCVSVTVTGHCGGVCTGIYADRVL